MNLTEYLADISDEADTFANCWLNDRPFDDDVKALISPFPTSTGVKLWVMDDWRSMVIVLKTNLESYNKYYRLNTL